jgi:hypothetical protein
VNQERLASRRKEEEEEEAFQTDRQADRKKKKIVMGLGARHRGIVSMWSCQRVVSCVTVFACFFSFSSSSSSSSSSSKTQQRKSLTCETEQS